MSRYTQSPEEPPSADWPALGGEGSPLRGSKRGKSIVPVVVGVALVTAVAGGIAWFVASGGDDDAAGSGPAETVTAFYEATQERDCGTLAELISTASVEALGGTREELVGLCQADVEVGDLLGTTDGELISTDVMSEDETTATVAVEERSGGETSSIEVDLVREDDAWRIDLTSGSAAAAVESETGEAGEAGEAGPPDPSTTGPEAAGQPGQSADIGDLDTTDPALSALRDACAGGSMSDCDGLFLDSPLGSALEEFAQTCGGRDSTASHTGTCEADYG